MYKTVKNVKAFNRNTLSTNAQIDLLFGGIDLTNIHMTAPAYTQESLVRTTTYETTEVSGVESSRLQIRLALKIKKNSIVNRVLFYFFT